MGPSARLDPASKTRRYWLARTKRIDRGYLFEGEGSDKHLRREFDATFGTTGLNDISTRACAHTHAESVSAFAFKLAWLIGSFHDRMPFNSVPNPLDTPKG